MRRKLNSSPARKTMSDWTLLRPHNTQMISKLEGKLLYGVAFSQLRTFDGVQLCFVRSLVSSKIGGKINVLQRYNNLDFGTL